MGAVGGSPPHGEPNIQGTPIAAISNKNEELIQSNSDAAVLSQSFVALQQKALDLARAVDADGKMAMELSRLNLNLKSLEADRLQLLRSHTDQVLNQLPKFRPVTESDQPRRLQDHLITPHRSAEYDHHSPRLLRLIV